MLRNSHDIHICSYFPIYTYTYHFNTMLYNILSFNNMNIFNVNKYTSTTSYLMTTLFCIVNVDFSAYCS